MFLLLATGLVLRYQSTSLISTLGEDLPPTYFIKSELENEDFALNSRKLYQAIPGPKSLWVLQGSNHYLNTSGPIRGLILGGVKPARRMAGWCKELAQGGFGRAGPNEPNTI